jgi:hypothetical protein
MYFILWGKYVSRYIAKNDEMMSCLQICITLLFPLIGYDLCQVLWYRRTLSSWNFFSWPIHPCSIYHTFRLQRQPWIAAPFQFLRRFPTFNILFYQEKGKHQLSRLDSVASHHWIKNKQKPERERNQKARIAPPPRRAKTSFVLCKIQHCPAHKGGEVQPLG